MKDEDTNPGLLLSMGREGHSSVFLDLDKLNLLGEPIQNKDYKDRI